MQCSIDTPRLPSQQHPSIIYSDFLCMEACYVGGGMPISYPVPNMSSIHHPKTGFEKIERETR